MRELIRKIFNKDYVSVIRCRDCEHFQYIPSFEITEGFCGLHDEPTIGWGYCFESKEKSK